MISFKTLDRILFQPTLPEIEHISTYQPSIKPIYTHLSKDTAVRFLLPEANNRFFYHNPNPKIIMEKTNRYFDVIPHNHSFVEMGYMYSGSCIHTIGDTHHLLKKGQFFILDKDTPHAVNALGENDILIAVIITDSFLNDSLFTQFSRKSVLSEFLVNAISKQTSHDNYIIFHSENSRRVTNIMNELMCEHLSPSINSTDIIDNLVRLLFLELINVYEDEQATVHFTLEQNKILPILKYIEANYTTCNLKGTASFFNMNANYLTTLLKKSTGYSFKELIQLVRFRTITMLLQDTDTSIEDIALQAGYENTTYFYKKFKEEYGCSPKEYRNKTSNRL